MKCSDCQTNEAELQIVCEFCGHREAAPCTVDSIVVPRELWERIVRNVSCDELLADIRRHNAES